MDRGETSISITDAYLDSESCCTHQVHHFYANTELFFEVPYTLSPVDITFGKMTPNRANQMCWTVVEGKSRKRWSRLRRLSKKMSKGSREAKPSMVMVV
ncbi:MAG: hypothetical protein F6K47_43605 [Symploca sp. SIO2E6]|nr:hypothetical protein [Symploca sp. SIO2E6]